MYKTNRQRAKRLVLAYSDTRLLYYFIRFLCIFLLISTFAIVTIGKYSQHMQNEQKEKLFGKWDVVYLGINEQDLSYFKNNALIGEYFIQKIKEKIFLKEGQRIVIGSSDESILKNGSIDIIDGRMPKKKNEVAIEKEYLSILNVNNVGDIIPIDSEVELLRGYKVCGIVDNYSERWKMINWDIKYINCFINNFKSNEINIFVRNNLFNQNDLKINIVNYKNNIDIVPDSIMYRVIHLWVGMSVLILSTILMMKIKIYNKITLTPQTREKYYIIFNNMLIYFLISINVVYIIGFVNDFILNQNVQFEFIVNEKKSFCNENLINNFGLYNSYSIVNCNNSICNSSVRELQFMSINRVSYYINIVNTIIYIILINIIICLLIGIKLEKECTDKTEYLYLKSYFYNIENSFYKYIVDWKIIIVELFLDNVIFQFKYFEMDFNNQKILINFMTMLIVLFISVLRLFFIKKIVTRKMKYGTNIPIID